jgi:hypothetical protein
LKIQRIINLGYSPEDTGRRTNANELLVVEATTDRSLPEWCGVHEPTARSKEELIQLVGQKVLNDEASKSLVLSYLLWQQGVLEAEIINPATGGV